jgi:biotin carboxyl carrier protein
VQVIERSGHALRYRYQGVLRRALAVMDGDTLHLALQGVTHRFIEPSPYPKGDVGLDPGRARAPVAGVVAHVAVAVGDRVQAGQPLVCVEAMKMEMWLHAAAAGTVRALNIRAKDPVAAGDTLVELEIEA